MVPLPLICFLSDQAPQNFQDIEVAKVIAVHKIRTFRYVIDMSVKGAPGVDGTITMSGSILRDISKDRSEISAGKLGSATTVSDGKTLWTLFEPQKTYIETKVKSDEVFDPKSFVVKCEANSFNYSFSADAQVGFATDPPLKLKSNELVTEAGVNHRKVVAESVSKKGNTISVVQWFRPDTWILERYTFDGTSDTGPMHGEGAATTIEFNAKFRPKDFTLDPAMISGFTKVNSPTANGGAGS